jgi:6,7-dimethyl-8-ribityllumazine synthase
MATANKNLSRYDPRELPDASDLSVALVVAEWNGEITKGMHDGAMEVLKNCGAMLTRIKRFNVPGAMEIPHACKMLCEADNYDAIIAIGCVVKGETPHFEYVCQSVTHGITELNLRYKTPVIYSILTDHNIEQSRARSGGKHGNKGIEAAVAALKMAGLHRLLS